MTHYILQIIVFQALFLGVYELFLKKETFFSLNRVYLLVTPFLAATIPLLEFGILQNFVPLEGMIQLPALVLSEDSSLQGDSTAIDLTLLESMVYFLKTNGLLIIYLLGTLVSFVLFLRKYMQLQHLKSSGETEKRGTINIVSIPKSRMACTFFNTVFLGEDLSEEETAQILSHELAHVEQKHSWDLLLFEMLRILLWFDPFIYRHQSQLSVLHEYIADEKVTQNLEKTTYFQNLLNTTFNTREISFANQFFNHSLIKKRIMMLQKPKSNRNAKLKFLLIIPMMLAMLTYVACSEDQVITTNEAQEIAPPPPPGPPTEAYQEYLELKKIMKAEGVDSDMTFEEYQVVIKIGKNSNYSFDIGDVPNIPFSLVEQVPVFPGCENLTSNAAKKECMSKKIRQFVNENFDIGLAKRLGLTGKNRISVVFKINKKGEVVNVDARAPRPELKKEAIRVVSSLPNMIPGKQDGKSIDVLYSLPIIFKVN